MTLYQSLRNRLKQPWFGGGIGAVLTAGLGTCLFLLPAGKGLRDWSYDLPFLLRPHAPVDSVVIVFLDEKSYHDLQQDPARFDRGLHAKLLKRLQAEGAKLAVFDLLFIDKTRPRTEGDQDFIRSLREFGKAIVGGQYHYDEHLFKNFEVIPPLDEIRDAAAGWGLVSLHRDADFAARQHHPGTDLVPSLAWRAANLTGASVTREPRRRMEERWLNHYSSRGFRGISFSDVVEGKPLPWLSFRDKVVFVGSGEVAGYSGEEKEQFRYPWSWVSGRFPFGVEIHALTFANLVRGDWLRRLPVWVELAGVALLGILLGYGLCALRPVAAAGAALLAAAAIAGLAGWFSAGWNVWFSWVIVVAAQIPLALGWSLLFNSIRAYMESRFLEHSLALYLSPAQVKQLLRTPELVRPGGEQKVVSILFSDITNFSKIAERMNPQDLVKLLNDYYETAIGCIHETEGTIMNLVGDAIFAIWNAPQDQPDHQERACRAALLLNERLQTFDEAHHALPLRTKVGLHTGTVCVGNIGSSTHFDYTAIGEAVNMATRLEGLNKQLGTNILATRDIQKSLTASLVTRLVGYFRFKGSDQVVETHELIGPLSSAAESQLWRSAFEEALHHFHRRRFDQAETSFRLTLERRPGDGPSRFYLARLKGFQLHPPPPEWAGEIELHEK